MAINAAHDVRTFSTDIQHWEQVDNDLIMHAWIAQDSYKPEIATRSEGVYFWTADGQRYLDFSSQAAFANIGLNDRRMTAAIVRQAETMPSMYGFANIPKLQLAERLINMLPESYGRIFFGCNGTDAIEAALKAARAVTGRQRVVAFWDEYHGASMGAASVTALPGWLARMPQEVPGTILVPAPYHYRSPLGGRDQSETDEFTLAFLRRTIEQVGPTSIAAIVAEPFSTGGGAMLPGKHYWAGVRQLCDEFGILLVADEIVTAFGRSGYWFARDYYEYEPDIICLAKGLSSGFLPLSAAVFRNNVADEFRKTPFWHGLTYTGHPVCCAAGLACIDILDEDGLVHHAAKLGDHLSDLLNDLWNRHPCVGYVQSIGLLATIELVEDRRTRKPFANDIQLPGGPGQGTAGVGGQISELLKQRNILVRGTPTFVRLVPPLIVTKEQVDFVVDVLDEILDPLDRLVTSG